MSPFSLSLPYVINSTATFFIPLCLSPSWGQHSIPSIQAASSLPSWKCVQTPVLDWPSDGHILSPLRSRFPLPNPYSAESLSVLSLEGSPDTCCSVCSASWTYVCACVRVWVHGRKVKGKRRPVDHNRLKGKVIITEVNYGWGGMCVYMLQHLDHVFWTDKCSPFSTLKHSIKVLCLSVCMWLSKITHNVFLNRKNIEYHRPFKYAVTTSKLLSNIFFSYTLIFFLLNMPLYRHPCYMYTSRWNSCKRMKSMIFEKSNFKKFRHCACISPTCPQWMISVIVIGCSHKGACYFPMQSGLHSVKEGNKDCKKCRLPSIVL